MIRYPAGAPEAADIAGAWVLHFDGGCRKGHGAGGFVLLDPEGRCHAGAGWYFGVNCPTNNVAEATAMARAIKLVRTGDWIPHRGTLVVRGDSGLVLGFMLGKNRPGKRELVILVKQTKEACLGWGRKVVYQWVPRADNAWADWLANVANNLQADVTLQGLQHLQVTGKLPIPAPGVLQGPGVGTGLAGGDQLGGYM